MGGEGDKSFTLKQKTEKVIFPYVHNILYKVKKKNFGCIYSVQTHICCPIKAMKSATRSMP